MNTREQVEPLKQPILVSVPELSVMLNLGRTPTWELVRKHKIKSIKIGRTRRVPVAAIQEYIDHLLDSEVA